MPELQNLPPPAPQLTRWEVLTRGVPRQRLYSITPVLEFGEP
jgi:hypothetical protein